ncbi:hypothetical protein GH714_036158 [Hevea brasiliensis]|uniref:Uncharacterized protein n=1 Tax=Hevea brasiliensis TaxID=3981 RepID=A0A6A6L7R2_HEVBR|nr:hypothetical protein GH714_036158 [Hevea brasiliensis]
MGDDDTVYFTENLVSVLAKHDHNQMWYIGGNSESVEQNVMHSYDMAFGGGGFAISYPLAEKLFNILDGCLDRYYYFYGSDQRIWACISEIGVPLTREQGFHQFDIRGNAYGLLAAHPVAPLTFKTWRSWSEGPFTFNTQPMKSDPCELPVVFMLEQAEEVGQSGSMTSYQRLEPRPERKCNRTDYAEAMSLQGIIVSALKLDPEYWTKDQARRRQCCDLKGGIKNNNMQIRIRKCRPWETITTER